MGEGIILYSILILGILGFVFAGLLALAADYFKIEEDLRIAPVMAVLPGTNCGACGSAGCRDFAEKLIKGEVLVSGCVAGGAEVASALAKVMGHEISAQSRKMATVHCGARESQRKKKAVYAGVKTCAAADLIGDGGLACSFACLGFGDCDCVCPFAAIKMEEGLPVIDPAKCTACGKCVDACPRRIISLRPFDRQYAVACSSRDPGAYVRKVCPVGCIACNICEKLVPAVFKVEDYLAVMDYSIAGADCRPALEKCPTRCIVELP